MKKLFWLVVSIFCSIPCFGFENYMLLADRQVDCAEIKNPEIAEVKIIDSEIYPERAILVIPKQEGKTCLTFCKGHRKIKLWVRVYENTTCIKKHDGMKMLPIDLPQELQ